MSVDLALPFGTQPPEWNVKALLASARTRIAGVSRRLAAFVGSCALTRPLQGAVDAFVLASAFACAYLLRFDFAPSAGERALALQQLPLVLLVQWSALRLSGCHAFVWRYVGMAELRSFVGAGTFSGAALLLARLSLPASLPVLQVPITVILIDAALAGAGIVGARVLRRAAFEHQKHERRVRGASGRRLPVLLIGAGHAGVMAVSELHARGDCGIEVKGFVDDDPAKRDAVIAGIRVLGSSDELPRLVPALGIDHVIITIAGAQPAQLRRMLAICRGIPVRAQITPSLHDVIQGRVAISHFRDVRTEELLERDSVSLDDSQIGSFIAGRVVMVTGAGGSIGSELSRQVARFAPAKLLLVERAEFALFEIDRELRGLWPKLEIVPLVGDVGDRERMRAILEAQRPQVIAHAAAHKHVPLMEANAVEAIKNNVFGTLTLGELAGQCGVEAFVMISTDKAVRPSSVMGASKRVAELVVQDLGRRYKTRYVAVRFGNVLGSAGSVIPIFQQQIARGGPVTITHPEMKRYFMTIPEAAVLVLEAGAMGQGGEIFVLDMGKPVRVLDMAKRLIELAGHRPEHEIEIVFTGVRPGEKLFEELETSDEAIAKTRHPKIFIGRIAGRSAEGLASFLAELRTLCTSAAPSDSVRARLAAFLPESELMAAPRAAGPAVVRIFPTPPRPAFAPALPLPQFARSDALSPLARGDAGEVLASAAEACGYSSTAKAM